MTPTFSRYLALKLGRRRGAVAWRHFFVWPFEASSFSQFWRRWNPVYGYVLTFYAYRPLTRILPRRAAELLTFLACGFVLHDLPVWILVRRVLPPGATITFAFLGMGAIASDVFGMDIGRWPTAARIATHAAYIAVCVAAMLLVVLRYFT